MTQDLVLAIDVGTGSVRAAAVTLDGRIRAIDAVAHDQVVPRYGWAEQSPAGWWEGAVRATRRVLEQVEGGAARIAAVGVCGQMHGLVLIDGDGRPVRELVPLWNDKRAQALVDAFAAGPKAGRAAALTANPPIAAWPGFKLAWLRAHEPETLARAATLLMPKDWITFQLTGVRASDPSEASLSYLLDAGTLAWSEEMAALLDVDRTLLPPLHDAATVIGGVSDAAADAAGLRPGTPVVAGAGDFPAALLGSGAGTPGTGSDVTGTSIILTLLAEAPLRDPALSNLHVRPGVWGAFTIQDAGGDAMRWARRAFHDDGLSYDAIVERAASVPPVAGGLLFLPYLNGERLARKPNSRAQFFGLARGHEGAHLHRAVMEGVAFAARRNLDLMRTAGAAPQRIIAGGGGARTGLWLDIKTAVYGLPLLVPAEIEASVIGAAMLGAVGAGLHPDLDAATRAMVRFEHEVAPDPAWAETYARAFELFQRLYDHSQAFYDDLDRLAAAPGTG